MSKAKSTPPSFNSLKSYRVWTEKGIFWKQSNKTASTGEISTNKWECCGGGNLGNGRHQRLDAIHILKTAVKITAYHAVPLGSHHSVTKRKGPLGDQFLPIIHVCSSFTWWIEITQPLPCDFSLLQLILISLPSTSYLMVQIGST